MKLLICSLALLSAVVADAQSLRAEVDASNKMISAAMVKKDFATMAKLFKASSAPGFQYVEMGKAMTLDQMIGQMQSGLGMFEKVVESHATIKSMNQSGSTGTGIVLYAMTGTMLGPDKKKHIVISSGTSHETYVKVGGRWKIKKMVWGNEKMTMDGKPFGAMKMGGQG